jgi:hypothetical protein
MDISHPLFVVLVVLWLPGTPEVGRQALANAGVFGDRRFTSLGSSLPSLIGL